ncbi:hypothetical protein GGR21_003937 [Dysgonomonas hofstadii]|uniref:Uncharacterized protein n=1 Tax=Dysgonomonas hofstadii TaxID=637886 RepID=A0A840CSK7_9BACT|nr:hypothetical protein [Dysgonomonas hofstadii]MBB4038011.1 hypothetical protein [Dysgonomonas hofstadii]
MALKYTQDRQVIHLYCKETDQHYYFGSIQAIYEIFQDWQIGVAAQTLYNRGLLTKYENDRVVIRKGHLIQKSHSKTD